MEDSLVLQKSLDFAVRVFRLCRYLSDEKREYVLSKQLLRSGTAVGAILREAKYAQSKKDFISKNSMALKEASETQYWLELLHKAEVLNEIEFDSIYADACELTKLLTSIVKTAKAGSPV